jgi:hypothetical protein
MTLSPKEFDRVVLLPQDREIMAITGLSANEYRKFIYELKRYSRIEPGTIVNIGIDLLLLQLVIGAALSYAATLLVPRARPQVQPKANQVQGQNIVNGARFTPKAGFDSVQNVVELGSVIPLVYANRQVIDGVSYGGIRVNTNLLWSQMYSVGGGQLLRAVFLVGEGTISGIDPTQFALGNNLINNYDLAVTDRGRVSIYYKANGGRIVSGDHVAGQIAANDLGNAENDGGGDVFQVRGIDNIFGSDFCFASTPSNQTSFGVYGFIGNHFGYRLNPVYRPSDQFQGDSGGNVACYPDLGATLQRLKQGTTFPGRAGIEASSDTIELLQPGDTVTYKIYTSTDANRTFTSGGSSEGCNDVGQAVAGRQKSYDETLSIGELYKIGTAVGICTTRTQEPFVSDADSQNFGSSQEVSATFEIVRAGQVHTWTSATLQADGGINATQGGHIYRFAEASFSTDREARIVEIGLRSSLQTSITGLCNFRDVRSYTDLNYEACQKYLGQPISGKTFNVFQNGNYSSPEVRYSFFRISYKVAGTQGVFTEPEIVFGVRSATGVALYNYLRLQFPSYSRWEVRVTPVTGYEIRSGQVSGPLHILDPHFSGLSTVLVGDLRFTYSGEQVSRNQSTFSILSLTTTNGLDPGSGFDDGTFFGDAWARLAESFYYSEITASTSQPEHSIVYVNTIAENSSVPKYDNMALVGMNIRSSTEISSLQQFSVYINKGINATSAFPEVLYDLLTNDRYGTGAVLNAAQIDKTSFDEATAWTNSHYYFFDGAVSEKINLRSWGAEVAKNFLLDLVVRNGKFALQPVATFNGPETIKGLYTAGNIIDDSFEMAYSELQDRIPVRISVKWRQEKESSNTVSSGLFPVVREVTVREPSVPADAPVEEIDLSDYCTSQTHAIDRAKWELRSRRYVTHSVKFKTTPTEATLDIGAVFKLGLETVTYSQPTNGAIASDGTVTAWPELADGDHNVLLWDGKTSNIQEVTMKVANGKTSYKNAVFCLRGSVTEAQTYKTQSLSFDEDGNIDVEATYFPTDSSGTSLLTQGWDVASNWVIEGAL